MYTYVIQDQYGDIHYAGTNIYQVSQYLPRYNTATIWKNGESIGKLQICSLTGKPQKVFNQRYLDKINGK